MTRADIVRNIINDDGYYYTKHSVLEIVNVIFDEHETAIEILMKANEEEISRHFNECEKHEAQLKAKDEEIERLKSYIEKLWQIVDDIDTYGDMAKSNDAMFRSLVENKQKERWELPITTDGYKLIYKESK